MTDVITNLQRLPSIQELGLTDSNIMEVSPNRNITLTNPLEDSWENGVINYNFSIPSSQGYRWSPDTSYFRADVKVVIKDGSPTGRAPVASDDFALASDFMNSIINNASVYIGEVAVSTITQFCGESSILRIRLSKTKNWLDSVGRYSYFIDSSFIQRQNAIIADASAYRSSDHLQLGYADDHKFGVAGAVVTITLNTSATPLPVPAPWLPGDTITYMDDAGPTRVQGTVATVTTTSPATHVFTLTSSPGDAALVVMTTPLPSRIRDTNVLVVPSDGHSDLQVLFRPPLGIFNCNSVIPATNSVRISLFPGSKSSAIQTVQNNPANFDNILVLIKQCYFYAHMFKDTKNFASGNYFIMCEETNIQNKTLNVGSVPSDTTHQFVIPSSTVSVSVWASSTDVGKESSKTPPTVFSNKDQSSRDITSLMLTYAGQQKPTQLYKTKFDSDSNQLIQRYQETQLNCNMAERGGEDYNTWLQNGNLYHTNFVRSSTDKSTALTLQVSFAEIPETTKTQIFVASMYRKLTKITINNGAVEDVVSLSV